MAGKRIIELNNKPDGWDPTYEMVIDYISEGGVSIPEALAIPLALVGNTYFQGSEDGVSWHDEVSVLDSHFRFSTDGGVVWRELETLYEWNVQVDGVQRAITNNEEYVNFVAGTNVTLEYVTTASGISITINSTGDGGTGVDNFIDLTDTDPTTYVGQTGKAVVVNAGETGLTFTTINSFPEPPDDGNTYGRTYEGDEYTWTTIEGDSVSEGPGIDVTDDTVAIVTLDFYTLAEDTVSDRNENYIMLAYYDLNTIPDPVTGLYTHYKDNLVNFSEWDIWNAKYLRDFIISTVDPTEGQILQFISNVWTPVDFNLDGDGDCYWYRNATEGTLRPLTVTDQVLINTTTSMGNYNFQVDGTSLFRLRNGIFYRSIYFMTKTTDTSYPTFRLYADPNGYLFFGKYDGSTSYTPMVYFEDGNNIVHLGTNTGLILGDSSYANYGNIRYHDGHFQGYNYTNTWVNLDEIGTGDSITITEGDGLTITNLGDNYTFSLGTPSTVTSSTTNAVIASSHTHALDVVLAGAYPTNGPGTYTEPTITVDSKGRIVAITEGANEGDCLWVVDATGIHYIGLSPRLNVGIGANSSSAERLLVKGGTDNSWCQVIDGSVGAAGGLFVNSGATGGWIAKFYNNSQSINALNLGSDGRLYLPTYTGTTMDPTIGDNIVRYLGVDAWGKVFTAEITGGGGGTVLTKWSVTGSGALGNEVRLTNDLETPGISKYYGTDARGIRGFFDLPTGGGADNYTDSIAWTAGTNTLTLGRTGILADLSVVIPFITSIGADHQPFELCINPGTAETFTIDIEATFAYTINGIIIETDSGTITTVTVYKNGVSIGSASPVSTKATTNFTSSVVIGDRISFGTSAGYTGTPSKIVGKLKITR